MVQMENFARDDGAINAYHNKCGEKLHWKKGYRAVMIKMSFEDASDDEDDDPDAIKCVICYDTKEG